MKKNIFLALVLTTFSLPAFAAPFAQRNCHPDDLQLQPNATLTTQCKWLPRDDASMQVTLHSSTIPLINAKCLFVPATKPQVNYVMAVEGHKAATIQKLQLQGNVVQFQVVNDFSNPNMNIIFYLDKGNNGYTPGNQSQCEFWKAT